MAKIMGNTTATTMAIGQKVEFWQPNTLYKAGQKAIAQIQDDVIGVTALAEMTCKKDHLSKNAPAPNAVSDFNDCWSYVFITSHLSLRALRDANYRPIHETYATKAELNDSMNSGGGLTPEELEKLNNAESIANKKTVIDETANDNDYPTTKAVLNYINETFLGGAW